MRRWLARARYAAPATPRPLRRAHYGAPSKPLAPRPPRHACGQRAHAARACGARAHVPRAYVPRACAARYLQVQRKLQRGGG